MKRRKNKLNKAFDLKVCRCCLSAEDERLCQVQSNEVLHLLTENEVLTEQWLCYQCRHVLNKISQFHKQCLLAEKVLKKYYTKYVSKGQDNTMYLFTERMKLNTNNRLSLSNTLCIDVSTSQEPDGAEDCKIAISSFSRDSNQHNNHTRDVKLEQSGDYDALEDDYDDNSCEFNALDVLKAVKEELDDSDVLNLEKSGYLFDAQKQKKVKRESSKNNVKRKKEYESATKKGSSREAIIIDRHRASEVVLTDEEQREEMAQRKHSESYVQAQHKCGLCVLPFRHAHTLETHMKKHDESRGSHVCPLCSQRFPSSRTLRAHQRVHATRLVCHACGARLRDRCRLREHLDWHAGASYPCPHCSHSFSRRTTLYNHMRINHGQASYKCDHCDKVFRAKETFKQHILRHSGVKTHRCEECPKSFYSAYNLSVHRAGHAAPRHYCVECDRHYKSAYILRNHLLKSSLHKDQSSFKFPCEECKRRFASREEMEAHVRTYHRRVAQHKCEVCGARYATRPGLYSHRRRHHQGYTLPLKHPCRTCSKSFSSKAILINHMRTHTGERPFECATCHRKFTQKSAMRTHVKLVHLKLKRNIKSKQKSTENEKDGGPGSPLTTVEEDAFSQKVDGMGWTDPSTAREGKSDPKQNDKSMRTDLLQDIFL